MPSRPWPWPWCGGWWLHQMLRDSAVNAQFDTITSFKQQCASGKIDSILVDAKTLMFILNFQSVALDVDLAEKALHSFLSVFPNTKLIFVFPVPGPNDGPNRRGAGNVPSDFTSARFDGIEPPHEHEATQLEEMAHYRSKRGALTNGIEISGYDTVFFREWITQRLWRLGHEVFNIEGINDHSQQLAMMAKDMKCDFVLSTYPDFYLYDMGDTGYVQFHAPYPLGRCPVSVYRAKDVARILGIPLQGLHELSCILGNHVLRPSVDEPLADWLDKVQDDIQGTREQVVKKFFNLTRERWSNGRTYTLKEQATYLHGLTGIDMKIMLNALRFYDIGNKRPNGVAVVDFPLVGPPQAREAYLDQLGYSDVVTFKETRLRAQYGDSFIRRFHVLERLRSLKYGLLMMSARECCVMDGRLDQLVTSTDHIVVEHRCDFSSLHQPNDTVRQYMVEAMVPKFTFFSAPGCAVETGNLSPHALFKAFETPGTIEYLARRSFFLNLFGANTAPITGLPEVLQPTAAALRFLMQVNVRGLDNAVDAFIQHLVLLQHRAQARVVNECRRNSSRRRASTQPDEQAFGYFFVITHALYASLVELNSLCNFPYADIPAFEKTFDYQVFCALFEHGSRLLTVQEIGEASAIHRAVTTGVRKHIEVDVGPHESMWVPPPREGRGSRTMSVPVMGASERRSSVPRPRAVSEMFSQRSWRHRWSNAKIVLEPNAAAYRRHAQNVPTPMPLPYAPPMPMPSTPPTPMPYAPPMPMPRSYVAQRRSSLPRVAAGPPSRTSVEMIPTRVPFAAALNKPPAFMPPPPPAAMHRRRSSSGQHPNRHRPPAVHTGPIHPLKPHVSKADLSQNWRRSAHAHDGRNGVATRPRQKSAPEPPVGSNRNRTAVRSPPPRASADIDMPAAVKNKVTLITAPEFYDREQEVVDIQREFMATITKAAAADFSKPRSRADDSSTDSTPSRELKQRVQLITAPDFYDRDLEVVDREREFSTTVTSARGRKHSVFDADNNVLNTEMSN